MIQISYFERYLKVIDRLTDIRNAQVAFKSVNGIYSNDFEELVKFVDSARFTIVQKRDSSYMQYDRVYRIDMLREVIVEDTLGYVSVKDSLFSNTDSYKYMASIPIDGIDEKFKLKDASLCPTSQVPVLYLSNLNKPIVETFAIAEVFSKIFM